MKIINRIAQFIDYKGISMTEFDKRISASNGYIGKLIRTNGSIGSDMIERIFSVFPDINPEWLILGEGPMLKPKSALEVISTMYDPFENFDKKCFKCKEKDARIESLLLKILDNEKEIAKLNREIGGLETELRILKKKIAQGPQDAGSVAAAG